jgi:hypothetical protein
MQVRAIDFLRPSKVSLACTLPALVAVRMHWLSEKHPAFANHRELPTSASYVQNVLQGSLPATPASVLCMLSATAKGHFKRYRRHDQQPHRPYSRRRQLHRSLQRELTSTCSLTSLTTATLSIIGEIPSFTATLLLRLTFSSLHLHRSSLSHYIVTYHLGSHLHLPQHKPKRLAIHASSSCYEQTGNPTAIPP